MAEGVYRWYDDGLVVRKFLGALIEAEILEAIEDVTEFVERPRKYNEAHEVWANAGAPENADADGWEDFVAAFADEDEEEEEEDE